MSFLSLLILLNESINFPPNHASLSESMILLGSIERAQLQALLSQHLSRQRRLEFIRERSDAERKRVSVVSTPSSEEGGQKVNHEVRFQVRVPAFIWLSQENNFFNFVSDLWGMILNVCVCVNYRSPQKSRPSHPPVPSLLNLSNLHWRGRLWPRRT